MKLTDRFAENLELITNWLFQQCCGDVGKVCKPSYEARLALGFVIMISVPCGSVIITLQQHNELNRRRRGTPSNTDEDAPPATRCRPGSKGPFHHH